MKATTYSYHIRCNRCRLHYIKAADHVTKIEKPTTCPRCNHRFPQAEVDALVLREELTEVDETPRAKGDAVNTLSRLDITNR